MHAFDGRRAGINRLIGRPGLGLGDLLVPGRACGMTCSGLHGPDWQLMA